MRTEIQIPILPSNLPHQHQLSAHPLPPFQPSPQSRKFDIAVQLRRQSESQRLTTAKTSRPTLDVCRPTRAPLMATSQSQAGYYLSLPQPNGARSSSVSDRSDRSDDSSDSRDRDVGQPSGASGPRRVPRKRASKPKVRTGCISCKKRHVKCDERKPGCSRCENLGVICEGYAAPKPRKPLSRADRMLLPRPKPQAIAALKSTDILSSSLGDVTLPLLMSPGFGFELGDEDASYFTMFRDQIVYDLSPCRDSNFWIRSSLRDSMTMRSIRHSILSIGAYARALVDLQNEYPWMTSADRPWWPASIVNRHHQAALNHHAQALSFLRQDIGANDVDNRTTMAATLLFIVFENMQGNYHAAGNLVRSGIKILNKLGRLNRGNFRWETHCDAFEAPDEIDEMAHMFSRHSIATVNTPFPHGKSAYHMLLNNGDEDDSVFIEYQNRSFIPRTLEHGRLILETLMASLGGFYVKAMWHNLNAQYDCDHNELATEQAAHLSKLQDFGNGLAALSSTDGEIGKLATLDFLTIHHVTATVFVSSCLDRTETMYDDHTVQFQEIINLAKRVSSRISSINKTGFSNEVAILPLLAFVVAKCRNHGVRLEALALIRGSSYREGPWDGTSLYNAMLGLMRLEGQEDADIPSATLPLPQDRWTWTNMFWDFEKRQMSIEYTKVLPNDFGEFQKTSWICNEELRWDY